MASAMYVGSIEVGKLADLVLWKPAFFGVKPEIVIKGGLIAGALMGDGNASIPTPQPCIYRPMFGAYGLALNARPFTLCRRRASKAKTSAVLSARCAGQGCRIVQKTDLKLNDAMPHIDVNPGTYEVRADGELLHCDPAEILPLAQRYFLF